MLHYGLKSKSFSIVMGRLLYKYDCLSNGVMPDLELSTRNKLPRFLFICVYSINVLCTIISIGWSGAPIELHLHTLTAWNSLASPSITQLIVAQNNNYYDINMEKLIGYT